MKFQLKQWQHLKQLQNNVQIFKNQVQIIWNYGFKIESAIEKR